MNRFFALTLAALTLVSCKFISLDESKFNQMGLGGDRISCDGTVDTRIMADLTGFDAINLYGSADVDVYQGEAWEVKVTANEDVFQHLDYTVSEGVLTLQTVDRKHIRAKKYHVYVTVPALSKITVNGAADMNLHSYEAEQGLDLVVNGAGDLSFEGGFKAPYLKVVLNGAGDIDAEGLDLTDLEVEVNGAGDADLSGRTVNALFRISGAGDIDASHLAKENVETSKNGVGSIKL